MGITSDRYWISWYSPVSLYGKFELHTPWWVSGETCEDEPRHTICAAIEAGSEGEAMQLIKECYDECPPPIEFRFCDKRPDDWSPFCDRFERADWMRWPSDATT